MIVVVMGQGSPARILTSILGKSSSMNEAAAKGAETIKILVVEDDDMVREYAEAVLKALGYNPCVAADGPAALLLLEDHRDIKLLLTDIGLPGMSGPDLAAEVRRRRPGLPVLFASGSIDSEGRAAELAPGAVVIAKPYRKAELAQTLLKLLADAKRA